MVLEGALSKFFLIPGFEASILLNKKISDLLIQTVLLLHWDGIPQPFDRHVLQSSSDDMVRTQRIKGWVKQLELKNFSQWIVTCLHWFYQRFWFEEWGKDRFVQILWKLRLQVKEGVTERGNAGEVLGREWIRVTVFKKCLTLSSLLQNIAFL